MQRTGEKAICARLQDKGFAAINPAKRAANTGPHGAVRRIGKGIGRPPQTSGEGVRPNCATETRIVESKTYVIAAEEHNVIRAAVAKPVKPRRRADHRRAREMHLRLAER